MARPSKKAAGEKNEATVSCHQCHQPHPVSQSIACKKAKCVLKYGFECLARKYNEKFAEEEESTASWNCPRCRRECNCTDCSKVLPLQKASEALAARNQELQAVLQMA